MLGKRNGSTPSTYEAYVAFLEYLGKRKLQIPKSCLELACLACLLYFDGADCDGQATYAACRMAASLKISFMEN